MAIQLSPVRTSWPLPSGTVRLAASWRRDGGAGLSGQIKKLRGMNLDLILTAYREDGQIAGLFGPVGLGGDVADWLWIAHDEKRGGRSLWDESALVDLSLAPTVVSKLTVAVVAHQPGTSFDQIPKAQLDLYGPESSDLLIQSEIQLCSGAGLLLDRLNVAILMDLERRTDGGWTALRDARWGYAEPGDLTDLKNTMECLA
jgi:hypothetical protein